MRLPKWELPTCCTMAYNSLLMSEEPLESRPALRHIEGAGPTVKAESFAGPAGTHDLSRSPPAGHGL